MRFPALTPRRLTSLIATAVFAVALTPVAALAAEASPAVSATTARATASATKIPAIRVNSAMLVAKGAGVRVAFTATCGAGDDGLFSSTTTQAVGVHVAQGTIGVPVATVIKCTGKPQSVSFLAAANVNGAPFRHGIALVQASLDDCPGANCTAVSTDKVLNISK